MSTMEIVALAGSVVLLLFSAVLAVAETAFTHLGRARAEAIDNARSGKTKDKNRDDDGNGNSADDTDPAHAGVLVGLLARRGQVLNPVLFLVLVCHLSIATIVAVVAYEHWGRSAVLVALGIELVVLYVAAEAAPKTWALQNTDVAAVRVAPLVRALAALAPLRWILRLLIGLANLLVPGKARKEGPSVSEDELLALAGVAAEASVIEASERALIESIIEFGDTIAREVMVPRTEMVTVGDDFRVDAAIEVAIAHGFSRLPAYGEGGIDDITGIVYAKDLMRAERDGHSEEPIRRPAAPGPGRARDQAGGRAAAGDAVRAVPHRHRHRRVRRHGRPGHAGGRHRGAGGRDPGRVRRRGAAGGARRRRRDPGPRPHGGRRGQRPAGRGAARGRRLGQRRRPRLPPARPRPGRGRVGRGRRATASRPRRSRAAASAGSG